jgi:uncharacterized protein (TIGR03435 family)
MRNATMSDIVNAFSRSFDRPVADETGLTGRFDLTIEWAPESPDGGAQADPNRLPTFSEAFRDQLGMKLESAKGPLEIPIIDHVEMPSEN